LQVQLAIVQGGAAFQAEPRFGQEDAQQLHVAQLHRDRQLRQEGAAARLGRGALGGHRPARDRDALGGDGGEHQAAAQEVGQGEAQLGRSIVSQTPPASA
jgi:hypothetical protein